MSDYKALKDIIPTSFEGQGIFSAMSNPIWVYDFDAADLDIFFITTYGERWAAPYLMHFDGNNGITPENLAKVASNIYRMHKAQWEHLYNDMKAEYNPIYNTDAHEVEKVTRTGHEDRTDAGTVEQSTIGNASASSTGSNSFDNKRAGFNTSTNVNDTSGTGSSSASTTSNNTSTTGSTSQQNGIINNNEDVVREYTKVGNIGTMRTSDILASDIKLWRFNFIKTVMQDISDMITLSTY